MFVCVFTSWKTVRTLLYKNWQLAIFWCVFLCVQMAWHLTITLFSFELHGKWIGSSFAYIWCICKCGRTLNFNLHTNVFVLFKVEWFFEGLIENWQAKHEIKGIWMQLLSSNEMKSYYMHFYCTYAWYLSKHTRFTYEKHLKLLFLILKMEKRNKNWLPNNYHNNHAYIYFRLCLKNLFGIKFSGVSF